MLPLLKNVSKNLAGGEPSNLSPLTQVTVNYQCVWHQPNEVYNSLWSLEGSLEYIKWALKISSAQVQQNWQSFRSTDNKSTETVK